VRSGISGGVEVARTLGSASLLHDVDVAFVHGLDVMLWCCAGIALAAALLALAFLPRRAGAPEAPNAAAAQPSPVAAPASPATPTANATPAGASAMASDPAGTE
jgi:hypothetical protein